MALLTPGTPLTGAGHRTVKLLRAAFFLQSELLRISPRLPGFQWTHNPLIEGSRSSGPTNQTNKGRVFIK